MLTVHDDSSHNTVMEYFSPQRACGSLSLPSNMQKKALVANMGISSILGILANRMGGKWHVSCVLIISLELSTF